MACSTRQCSIRAAVQYNEWVNIASVSPPRCHLRDLGYLVEVSCCGHLSVRFS
jgi:hypothetical protein